MKIFLHTSATPALLLLLVLLAPGVGASEASFQIPRLSAAPGLESFLTMDPRSGPAREMARVEGFVQRDPHDGEPATRRTEVYAGYDASHVYFVFVCHDPEPQKVRARLARRENVSGDDLVSVWLDTFQDRRRAYVFQANPYGVQWDALYTEGQGLDVSFDTVWHSRGERTAGGYVVWMAIPVKSLRFPPSASQRWGLIFNRYVPRGEGENAFWPPVSNRVEGRLNQAALATGLEDLSPGRNLQLIPYFTARSFEILDGDAARFVEDDEADAGFDAKVVLRDRWVVDATANPDFSQVESDDPQVTVNQRFEIFFPEKRPFFLENAGYFSTPLTLLFTRRIADPRLGIRLTGKAGPYAVGALAIDDEAPGRRVPDGHPLDGATATFGALRIARDLGDQSSVGFAYVGRELAGSANRVAGFDSRIKLGENWVTSLQAVASSTREPDGSELDDAAYDLQLARSGNKLNYFGRYRDVGPDFRTEAGFVPRLDLREVFHFVSYWIRPEGGRLLRWGPEFEVRRNWDHAGTRLDEEVEGSLEWSFTGGTYAEVNYGGGRQRLRPGDVAGLAREIDFDFENLSIEYGTAASDLVGLDGVFAWGRTTIFSPPAGVEPSPADYLQSNLSLRLRPFDRLKVDNTWLLTELETPAGERVFSQHVLRSRWNWQFSRRASLRVILQYESTVAEAGLTQVEPRRSANADVLFTYRVNPWRALFVGYNGNYQDLEIVEGTNGPRLVRSGSGLSSDARQVFVKYSHLLRF